MELVLLKAEQIPREQFKSGITSEQVEDTYNGYAEQIINILNRKRWGENERFNLRLALRGLQKYNEISTVTIRYLLLSNLMEDPISVLHTNYAKALVKREMKRFYRFLKENKIKTYEVTQYFKKEWFNGVKVLGKRPIHTLMGV